jgi:hypothetical protein
LKHKNSQPLYIFNRENPQNSEPQNGPRRGLDFIALVTRLCHAWDLLGRDDGYLMADIGQTLDFSSKIRLSVFLV